MAHPPSPSLVTSSRQWTLAEPPARLWNARLGEPQRERIDRTAQCWCARLASSWDDIRRRWRALFFSPGV